MVNGHSSCIQKPIRLLNSSSTCISLYKVCCWNEERGQACTSGESYSRVYDNDDTFSCSKSSERNTLHGSSFLECCECCHLGKTAAKKNSTCRHDAFPVNQKCGQVYQRCCSKTRDAKNGPMTCEEADCAHLCQKTSEGPKCSCRTGYKLSNDTRSCADIDECLTNTHKCMAGFKCRNLIGSYRCNRQIATKTCRKGYKFERGVCRDIDECVAGTANCASGTVCENVLGSFLCTNKSESSKCSKGYYGVGVRCVDLNECLTTQNPCKRGERCINTYGSFHCAAITRKCPPGYNFNLRTLSCRDINECSSSTSPCKRSGQVCRNTPGSFRCVCKRGYLQKNGRCNDRDECKIYGGKLCNHICTNLPGSFRCECREGFRLASNRRTCMDINECTKKETCPAAQTCFNLPGSHKCIETECPVNYLKRSYRSCILNCTVGLDCQSLPVSVKWFAVSRRGPIKKYGFRLIYDVDVSKIRSVEKVVFKFEKGNEKNTFALQKYGFSRVIIFNKETIRNSKHNFLKIVGTAIRKGGRRPIKFNYNLYTFIYVPL